MEFATIFKIALYALIAWFLYTRFGPVKGLKNLGSTAFAEEMNQSKQKMLLDVREPHEFKMKSIPGAVNIPLSQLHQRTNEIPKDKDIFLYCQSGMRSKQAAKHLSKSGYSKIFNLRGGILSWNGNVKK